MVSRDPTKAKGFPFDPNSCIAFIRKKVKRGQVAGRFNTRDCDNNCPALCKWVMIREE